jgi:hypothetical protein
MTRQITPLELIEETVQYYESNPSRRSVKNNYWSCYYKHPDNGNMCAVGRCFNEHGMSLYQDSASVFSELMFLQAKEIFKEQYHSIPLQLWKELQLYHDEMWGDKETDAMRAEYVEKLKAKWS